LWQIEVAGKTKTDQGLKFGAVSVKTIKRIELPEITLEQKIIFGILCAMEVYKDDKFCTWGNHWIDGSDRSEIAARAAWEAGAAVWAAAVRAAEAAAAWAAETWAAEAAAARAAGAAVWAARAVRAEGTAEAAEAAARAAEVVARAAESVTWIAESVTWIADTIDFHSIAIKAISYK
jgi:hypothetical protein